MPNNVKFVAVGDGGVGKTTMLNVLIKNEYRSDTKMTLGVSVFTKEISFNKDSFSVVIMDCSGQERFKALHQKNNIALSKANGAMLMFDLTRTSTLENLDFWVELCRREDPNMPILFIGSKLDLTEEINVPDDLIKEIKDEMGFIDWIKISSKTRKNLEEVFEILLKNIIKK